MAITPIGVSTVNPASGVTMQFTTLTRGFWLSCNGVTYAHEGATLERLGPDAEYATATNKDGVIAVSNAPNTMFVDLPPGTYRLNKPQSIVAASFGFEAA